MEQVWFKKTKSVEHLVSKIETQSKQESAPIRIRCPKCQWQPNPNIFRVAAEKSGIPLIPEGYVQVVETNGNTLLVCVVDNGLYMKIGTRKQIQI